MSDKLNFRHKDVDDEETKEKYRNDPFASVTLLGEVISSLQGAISRFEDGNLSLFSEICLSKDTWDCINYARLWPETHYPEVDSLMQDALSHIADAHYMTDGAFCWGPGEDNKVYKHAFPKIAADMKFAIDLLKQALDLIDDYINKNLGDEKEGK